MLKLVFLVRTPSEAKIFPSPSFIPTDNCRNSSALLPSWDQCLNWSSSDHSPCTCSVLCSNKTLTGPAKHFGECLQTNL